MASKTWVLIGNGSLLAGCGDVLLRDGHAVAAIVTSEPANERWAAGKGIRVEPSDTNLAALLRTLEFDHLASIAHLSVVPAEALRLVPGLAINFHDGPLPELAGLNVTSWAILRGETVHGITWHTMTEKVDAGLVLEQRRFDIAADDTAFLLNAKCYAAGLESFSSLVTRFNADDLQGQPQDLATRQYFGRWARPAAAGVIDWSATADEVAALVRALDFGGQANPLDTPKLFLGDRFVAARQATATDDASRLAPGTVVRAENGRLLVATRTTDVVLEGLTGLDGSPAPFDELSRRYGLAPGRALPALDRTDSERLTDLQARAVRAEGEWRGILKSLNFPDLDLPSAVSPATGYAISGPSVDRLAAAHGADGLLAAAAVLVSRQSGESSFDLVYSDAVLAERVGQTFGAYATQVPLRVTLDRDADFAAAVTAVAAAREPLHRRGSLAVDLWSRYQDLHAVAGRGGLNASTIAVGVGATPAQARIRVDVSPDGTRAEVITDLASVAQQLTSLIANVVNDPAKRLRDLDLVSDVEKTTLLETWNDTVRQVPGACVHELFAMQAAATPDATAVIQHGREMTYRELDERTNRLARHLRALGVGPDALVGIFLQRSFAMVEAVLATLKAGGAYVPLDPAYPADRLAFMAEDAEMAIIITDDSLHAQVPSNRARIVNLDTARTTLDELSAEALLPLSTPSHLAYVIYTSGSTGRPKGVMIEHRNVVNFFVGMDEHIDVTGDRKTWLAVTSLSFDISVLELLWTLSRGFSVVLHRDTDREAFVSVAAPKRPVDFSLFYFSSDESEHAQNKYRLLLEGARFADDNDFVAVWSPERHFHAFGGLFPNPAVTSAAVAAITKKVGIRAGSVVSPLHPVLRIAEEWSVVDNLSNGRVGISFAPGWQPNDFVLEPENFRNRKDLMFEQIESVRKLWRGESLPFKNGTGETVEVRVLPRPIQKELPVWVTIAGNPESFIGAARAGANVLTHLLGQTIKDVADKVALYRRTWREAGHAGEGIVTVMVHTFVGDSDDEVKELVRKPMKEYLKSAVGLIREAAWSFPTIKQKATSSSGEFTPDTLTPEDMDALLDYAFERYYETSALFGSVTRSRQFVDSLRDIGVDEVACLIDFGVPTDRVLASLPQLAEVTKAFKAPRAVAQTTEPAMPAETIPALMRKHQVTHFQCTPTMAQIVLQDEEARQAFGGLRQMLVGGEGLPDSLARELAQTVGGRVTNVYGPTETTVWSSAAAVTGSADVTIGFPIANTTLHVLDRDGRLAPVGVAGELFIGGQGVVRGYWKRPDLTSDRFVVDPFSEGRLYRTGDLVRRRTDGALEFLGRLDHQVKIRGHRIELGEIEGRLREHPGIQDVVVIARNDGAGPELVAYVIARNGAVEDADVRTHLRSRVPEYMMPRSFVTLTAFPMTPNRKIDRKALPAPQQAATARAAVPVTARPEAGVEQTIAEIWCEVLEISEVGVDTNFADVGGHSLAMVRVLGRLKERLSAPLTLVDLFRHTTIRALAKHLSTAGQPDAALEGSALRAASRRAALAQRGRVRSRV